MLRRVIYGESNYAAIVRENGYFVDKTAYIAKLEGVKNPVFLRPRRIGKSLFCSILRYYYDLNYAERFGELFGQTWIGQQPTPSHNQHILLFFNFSVVDVGKTVAQIEHSFKNHCNTILTSLRAAYAPLLGAMPEIVMSDAVSDNLEKGVELSVEYFNELHQIDVSTRYAETMQTFVNQPNLEHLFAGYWTHYISQLPEAIFQKVNENFYRTTFFELCNRYLSRWFTWNAGAPWARSYPQGKSDPFGKLRASLEFVGKYHEKFAGLRWVIEFKYFSNSNLKTKKIRIDQFELLATDSEQIRGYAQGLQQEYPEAKVALFVIYCFGNQGFRIFAL